MSLALELAWKTSLYFVPTLFVKKSTSENEKWANGFMFRLVTGVTFVSQ